MFRKSDKTHDIHQFFKRALRNKQFVTDRSGVRTLEMLGAHFEADRPAIIGTPNPTYIAQELAWYRTQSLNINDMAAPPAQWRATANAAGEINSNYGWILWHPANHNQYDHVLQELQRNPDSRRACAVYNRPSIHQDWCERGKNDFICTNAVTYYIREAQLHTVVQMRSNDVVYGYKNDWAWQHSVVQQLCVDLKTRYPAIRPGRMWWQVQNLHVYERHFQLI